MNGFVSPVAMFVFLTVELKANKVFPFVNDVVCPAGLLVFMNHKFI